MDAKPTKYQIRIEVPGAHYMPMSWNCKRSGRPTEANLRKWVIGFEASTLPGGCNAHLGPEIVRKATVLLNDGSQTVVAEYSNPIKLGALSFTLVTEYVQK